MATKLLVVLATFVAVGLTKPSASLYKQSEIKEFLNNPRYMVIEIEEGVFEVEDLETSVADITLTATDDDVTFYVYTPENTSGAIVKASEIPNIVKQTGFNLARSTIFVVHGWKNSVESAVNDRVKVAALANRNNINVVVIDWSPIATKNYISAQGSVLAVGNFVGDFLIALNSQLNYSWDSMTLVGHSLGAHVSGNAGARTGGKVGTIVGLDPAGPLFTKKNINNRLDPTDGAYVHCIHTNTAILGTSYKTGHVNFYPNGGSSQPGCGLDVAGSCAHSRAYEYYAESLNSNNFSAYLCDSYSNYKKGTCSSNTACKLGWYPVAKSTSGDYYLYTNSKSPFAQG
ncbi:pancreatic lipase-related protein 2-like [Anthonomus grandis grandis]|uniref:pancreatic lipase-related protein 2-like n=1 Tax=Anthonomus grandis grandis TaxID=2921223 RepID=UPI002165FB26|nr:pancreatic lipase-related protein 2-like [Anthonomus grandis grandis]